MPHEVAVPENLRRHFSGEVLGMARKILDKGRVEAPVFFRSAVAGRVVMPNGSRLQSFLVADRSGTVVHASCSCLPKQLPSTLCAHLAALAASAARGGPDAEPELPGERFEKSVWMKAATGLHGLVGPEARLETEVRRRGAWREIAVARDGSVRAELAVPKGHEPWPLLSGVMRQPSKPGPVEARLIELSTTPEEAALNREGARTQRQTLEASFWYLLAKQAYETFGGNPHAPLAALEVSRAGLWLVVREGEAGFFRMSLAPETVDSLHRRDPAFLAGHGLPIVEGSARPALRVSLEKEGAIRLSPVFGIHLLETERFVPNDGKDSVLFGGLLLDVASGTFVPTEKGRRFFAEPEAALQTEFQFDEAYRPSPAGLPLDRETVVPAEQVARFLTRHRDELAQLPADLLPPELRSGLVEPEAAELVAHREEGGRFVLGLTYLVNGAPIPFETILRSRRRREPLLACRGALLDPQSTRFGWMDLLEEGSVRASGAKARLVLPPLSLCRLRSYLPADQRLSAVDGASTGALSRIEAHAPDTAEPPPEDLGLSLYDFQKTGYAWLWFLYRSGYGGLLCDDMGLGKTHQVMALLAAIRAVEGRWPSVLVVCPASVLPHWEEKLRTFLPGLGVRVHHGAGRGAATARDGVLLTTYGTLRNDAPELAEQGFDLFVLDEIQTIKNRSSATHQALLALKARIALGLTGTPVENGVEELRNLLDFVLPAYLPGDAAFQKTFARPIEEGDWMARERLKRLVGPFVLRRSKEQVLSFLPEKIEDRRLCSLTTEQAVLYRELVEVKGAPLASALEGPGPVPYLHVFALLTKLKRLCDHPDLLLPPGAPPTGRSSGKWELFTELLDEALGSGLKVVVYSQYLRMLDIMAAHLEERGTVFEEIRGSTVDRARPVARFRDDPACRVFLASLKAAGLGIDLTPASVVVHYDRWWTAARERQATDRVHRLGQTRGVQVLTLVTAGTIEERIDRIIARKAQLAADVVPEDEPGLLKRFTREELRELLEA